MTNTINLHEAGNTIHDKKCNPVIDSIDNPIFIIGSGRSGTTLLRMMLNAHPNIYISHEASYYLFKPKARTSGEWLDFYKKTISFLWMKFPCQEIEKHIPRNLPRHEMHQIFDTLMRIKATQYNKTHYGDKTPSYCWYLKRILADFPNAKIIHIVRDPVATATSMRGMPWTPRSIVLISLLMAMQTSRVGKYKDKILEVRLEDLLESPEAIMRRMLGFVGEEWYDQVLRHQEFAPLNDMPPFPWFATAQRKATTDTGLTATVLPNLTLVEKAVVEYINRNIIRRYGYQRAPFKFDTLMTAFLYVVSDIPLMCLDSIRMAYVLIGMRNLKNAKELLWPDEDAWKYYPDFNLHDVTEWEDE